MPKQKQRIRQKRSKRAITQFKNKRPVIRVRTEDALTKKVSQRINKRYDYSKGAWRLSKGKGKGPGKTKTPKFDPYDITQPLSGKQLQKTVQSQVRQQIRPVIKAYARQEKQLRQQQAYEIAKAQGLGEQAAKNISAYYQFLGQEAQKNIGAIGVAGNQLIGGTVFQGAATQQALNAGGQQVTAGLGQNQSGQPISARDQLAQLITMQQGAAGREQAALNSQAFQQAGGFNQMAQQMRLAALMQGGAIQGDVARQIGNQVGDIRQSYAGNLSKVRGARLDLLAQRPELLREALMNMRESERNYILSLGALKLDAKQLKQEASGNTSGERYVRTAGKVYRGLNKQKAALERRRIQLQNQANRGLLTQRQQGELRRIQAQQAAYGKGGGGDDGYAGGYRERSEVFSYLRKNVRPKTLASSKKARTAAYDNLRSYGATDKDARWAIKRYVKRYKKRSSKKDKGSFGVGEFLGGQSA